MAADATSESATGAPIPEVETGVIGIMVGDRSFPISEIEHWTEDGLHIFRSTEFDCQAEAEGELDAVGVFLEHAEDLFQFLDDLVDARHATEHEVQTLAKLSRRFYEVYSAQRQQLLLHKRVRSRDIHRLNWQRRQTRTSSSEPVLA